MRVLIAVVSVWAILFVVPFIVYGSTSGLFGLKPPEGPAWRFLSSVAVTKLGTAVAFVALFTLTREEWRGHWLLYAAVWFLMFAISEIGDVLKGGYTAVEAMLGIVSEAVYAPVSALTIDRLFR